MLLAIQWTVPNYSLIFGELFSFSAGMSGAVPALWRPVCKEPKLDKILQTKPDFTNTLCNIMWANIACNLFIYFLLIMVSHPLPESVSFYILWCCFVGSYWTLLHKCIILCIKIREITCQIRTLLLFRLFRKKKDFYCLFSMFRLICCIVLKKRKRSEVC